MKRSSDQFPTVRDGPKSSRGDHAAEDREPVASRYRHGDEIARGGMGRVVEATDLLLNRAVAIKQALDHDRDALQRFARETELTARLEHPAIVPVYDAGTDDNGPFYVMRKVSGQPLEDLLRARNSLDERLALLPNVLAAAQAVAHAHDRGVIHRDIKPSNILVGALGETVVIDWGLAKSLTERDSVPTGRTRTGPGELHTAFGAIVGTPGFMSLEQLRGESSGPASDVYALGATLYCLLAQRPPHTAESYEQVIRDVEARPATPIAQLVAGTPRELATIVDKALAPSLTDRYADAGALARDLQQFLAGQLVASHRYSTRERLARFVRRHRFSVVTVGAAVAALAIGGGLAIREVVRERDRADDAAQLATERQLRAEQAETRARQRADQLFVSQTQTLVATNPTAAVAQWKDLARRDPAAFTRLWRFGRALGAAARVAGVARGYPGPIQVANLQLSRTGRWVAAVTHGDVWLYDLDRESYRVLSQPNGVPMARFVGDETLVINWRNGLEWIDLASGDARRVALPASGTLEGVTAGYVYWNDPSHTLWRTAAAPPHSHQRVADHVGLVAVAANAVAIYRTDRSEIALLDDERALDQWRTIWRGEAVSWSWSPNGEHAAVLDSGGVTVLKLGNKSITSQRVPVAGIPLAAGQTDLRTYVASHTGLVVIRGGNVFTQARINPGFGLHPTVRGLIAASENNRIFLFGDSAAMTVTAPFELTRIAASATSSRIIGTGQGHLLVWNLDAIAPRFEQGPTVTGLAATGDDGVMYRSIHNQWMLVRGQHPPRPLVDDALFTVQANGDSALFTSDRGFVLVDLATAHSQNLATTDVQGAALCGDHRAAVWSRRRVRIIDVRGDDPIAPEMTFSAAPLLGMACRGDWLIVAQQGIIVRKQLSTGRESVTPIATVSDVAIRPDGTTLVASGRTIMVWDGDHLTEHFTVPSPVVALIGEGEFLLVRSIDGASYRITMTSPGQLISSLPSGTNLVAPDPRTGLGIFVIETRPIIVDLEVGIQWPLSQWQMNVTQTAIYKQQVRLIGDGHLLTGDLALPLGPDETRRWLDSLTNATAEAGPGTLSWPQ